MPQISAIDQVEYGNHRLRKLQNYEGASLLQHTPNLAKTRARIFQVTEAECHRCGLEGGIGKRQLKSIGLDGTNAV